MCDALIKTGTKGVARAMNKICHGPAYKEGNTWFRQLSDKRKIIMPMSALYVNSFFREEYKDTFILGYEKL